MSFPRKFPTSDGLGVDERDHNAIVDRVNGISVEGITVQYPCSYIVRDNGGFYEAIDQFGNLTYGGSADAGTVDGDNAAAVINAAIVATEALGGGKIHFQTGNYTLTDKIHIQDDNVWLEGEGMATKFIQDGAVVNLIDLIGTLATPIYNIVLSDFQIYGDTADARLLNGGYVWPLTIRNVKVVNGGANTGYSVVGFNRCYRLSMFDFDLVDNNDINLYLDQCHSFCWTGGRTGWGTSGQTSVFVVDTSCGSIRGVTFEHAGGAGLSITTDAYETRSITVEGCYFEHATTVGISVANGLGAVIRGNYFNGDVTSTDGIYVNATGTLIDGNTFVSHTSASISLGASATDTAIEHNYSTDSTFKSGTGTRTTFKANPSYITESRGSAAGTGSEASIAHGLSAAPSYIYFGEIDTTALPYRSSVSSTTHIKITATNGKWFSWKAEV
jgi:hypothetical protein